MGAAAAGAEAAGGGAAAAGAAVARDIKPPTEALMELAAPDDVRVVEREGGKLNIEFSLGNTVTIEKGQNQENARQSSEMWSKVL